MRGRKEIMHGRRVMHGRDWISVAINGRMGREARKALMCYIYSCLSSQSDRSYGAVHQAVSYSAL